MTSDKLRTVQKKHRLQRTWLRQHSRTYTFRSIPLLPIITHCMSRSFYEHPTATQGRLHTIHHNNKKTKTIGIPILVPLYLASTSLIEGTILDQGFDICHGYVGSSAAIAPPLEYELQDLLGSGVAQENKHRLSANTEQ